EGTVHAAEAVDHLLLAVSCDLERLHHRLGPMVPNAAGGDLVAVAGDVVLEGLDGQRILRLKRLKPALRHRERVMREVDLFLLLVILIHREIDDPGEFETVLVDEVEFFGDLAAGKTCKFPELVGVAGHEESCIALGQSELLADPSGALGPDIVGQRTCALVALTPHDVAETRLALALRPGVHAVAERAAPAPLGRDRPDLILRILEHAREHLEAGAAEML